MHLESAAEIPDYDVPPHLANMYWMSLIAKMKNMVSDGVDDDNFDNNVNRGNKSINS